MFLLVAGWLLVLDLEGTLLRKWEVQNLRMPMQWWYMAVPSRTIVVSTGYHLHIFRPDGYRLRVWEPEQDDELIFSMAANEDVIALAVSSLRVFSKSLETELWRHERTGEIALSDNELYLLHEDVLQRVGVVRVHTVADGTPLRVFTLPHALVDTLAISDDGLILYSGPEYTLDATNPNGDKIFCWRTPDIDVYDFSFVEGRDSTTLLRHDSNRCTISVLDLKRALITASIPYSKPPVSTTPPLASSRLFPHPD